MKSLKTLILVAALAVVLTSCSSVPANEFTRDDTSVIMTGTVTEYSQYAKEQTTDNSDTERASEEAVSEALTLSVELLSSNNWSDPSDDSEYVSTIVFSATGSFVMTVNMQEESAGNCMGLFKISGGTVYCTVSESDLGGKLKTFTLEYIGSSLVYRGETIGAVMDGTEFI